jgi:glutamate-1-semialdehyde 2,1-aminomutase
LRLSAAKHRSLAGHAKWSRRIARWVPAVCYGEERFFDSDGAPEDVAGRRRAGLERLGRELRDAMPKSTALLGNLADGLSDLRFTTAYRIPFPYREVLNRMLVGGSVVTESREVELCDLDGNWRYDLGGSYGLNVFGYGFYKECIAEGARRVEALGPVLGPYHPVVIDIVERLKRVSGLDEVSFHMSGTEAVMQAVRLARYHTGRTHLVRFCGAYHGWWDGVQPGVGNGRRVDDVYTLADHSERTLRVLETRRDIACVLVSPMQALHPNADAPGDGSLLRSDRKAGFDREAATAWLRRVREICTKRGIVLVFDEVFTGFRLGYRGAQGYFGIQADLVTYGKTLGGGLPVGVVCGRRDLMKRFRDDAPADVCLARGTFNAHPYVLGAMHVFLERLESPEMQARYERTDEIWGARVAAANRRLEEADVPVRLAHMHSVVTVLYTTPSRYDWMFQFYLRAAGLELGWTGTGRFILSLAYTDEAFAEVTERLVRAALAMRADGWWWHSPELTNQAIGRMMMRDLIAAHLVGLRSRFFGSAPATAEADPRPEHAEDVLAVQPARSEVH